MLETIREYAAERLLQAGEQDTIAARHANTFLNLAEQARERLFSADQVDWLDLLALEHDNFRVALDFLETHVAEAYLQLAGALSGFWWRRGHLSEGLDRLRRAVALVRDADVPLNMRARALDGAGALAEAQGKIEQATVFHTEALALWEQAGDRLGQAHSLENLGIIEMHDLGNAAAALAHHETALALYEAENDRLGIAIARRNLGDVALMEEQFSDAANHYREALTIARELDDVRNIAASLTSLGALAFFENDLGTAIRLYEESLPIWRQLNDVPGTALVLGNLGEALDHSGRSDDARALYEESLGLVRELGDLQGMAFAQSHLARIARRNGELDHAATLFAESARIFHQIGDSLRLAECIEGLAGTLTDVGEASQAARLFGVAAAIRHATDSPLPTIHAPALEHDLAAVRAMIGKDQFQSLYDEGTIVELTGVESELDRAWRAIARHVRHSH